MSKFAGWSLEKRRGVQRVESNLPAPDPKWRFTDKAGHEHYRSENDWPTLKWVVDETWWCEDCRSDHESGHFACVTCDEPINPGTKAGPHVDYVPGLWEATAKAPNGSEYELRYDEFEALEKFGAEHVFGVLAKREPDRGTVVWP